jgi:hypothetical protein
MNLKDIIAISGEPGLFKFIAQGKNAIIVEHIETKKRISAYSSAKISSLEDISIFTEDEDMPLGKVFDKIYEKENGGPSIDPKSEPAKLKNYFEEVLPQYAKERVYPSDIKKVVSWYNLLLSKDMLVKDEPVKEEAAGEMTKPEGSKDAEPENLAEGETKAPEKKKRKTSASSKNNQPEK